MTFFDHVAGELSKTFIHLGHVIVDHRQAILGMDGILKDHLKGKYSAEMASLNMGIQIYNDSLDNVISYIRSSEDGYILEDITLYLEGNCRIKDIQEYNLNGSFFHSADVKAFQKAMSVDNLRTMITDIMNIAFDDRNPEFIQALSKTGIAA